MKIVTKKPVDLTEEIIKQILIINGSGQTIEHIEITEAEYKQLQKEYPGAYKSSNTSGKIIIMGYPVKIVGITIPKFKIGDRVKTNSTYPSRLKGQIVAALTDNETKEHAYVLLVWQYALSSQQYVYEKFLELDTEEAA